MCKKNDPKNEKYLKGFDKSLKDENEVGDLNRHVHVPIKRYLTSNSLVSGCCLCFNFSDFFVLRTDLHASKQVEGPLFEASFLALDPVCL